MSGSVGGLVMWLVMWSRSVRGFHIGSQFGALGRPASTNPVEQVCSLAVWCFFTFRILLASNQALQHLTVPFISVLLEATEELKYVSL